MEIKKKKEKKKKRRRKKIDGGEELKMAAPLSFFKCTMTTRAES